MSEKEKHGETISSLHGALSDDKSKLIISLDGTGQTLELTTSQIDQLVAAIAEHRPQMAPEIRPTYQARTDVIALNNPAWYSELEMSMGGSLFHFRHPAFGWISSWFSRPVAAKLAQTLRSQDEYQQRNPVPKR